MKKNTFLSSLTAIALGIFLAIIIRAYIILVGYIPSESMENTLYTGDYIFANKLSYLFSAPKRGDIICFNHKGEILDENIDIDTMENEIYIKRIIGLPGDHIEINKNIITINGEIYQEAYIKEDNWGDDENHIYDVPENSYFLLGDNRNNSFDSRYWKNPYITKKDIVAKFSFIIMKGKNR